MTPAIGKARPGKARRKKRKTFHAKGRRKANQPPRLKATRFPRTAVRATHLGCTSLKKGGKKYSRFFFPPLFFPAWRSVCVCVCVGLRWVGFHETTVFFAAWQSRSPWLATNAATDMMAATNQRIITWLHGEATEPTDETKEKRATRDGSTRGGGRDARLLSRARGVGWGAYFLARFGIDR